MTALPKAYKTEITQRAYDKKYVLWAWVNDPHYNISGIADALIPKCWAIMGIFVNPRLAEARRAELLKN